MTLPGTLDTLYALTPSHADFEPLAKRMLDHTKATDGLFASALRDRFDGVVGGMRSTIGSLRQNAQRGIKNDNRRIEQLLLILGETNT